VIRTSPRGFTAIAALAVSLIGAGGAHANTVSYTGEGIELRAGQTRGLPILIGFDLRGRGCPAGPHCFDHASVRNFVAVSWAYPNCLEVLDSLFELDKNVGNPVTGKSHRFSASGPNEHYEDDHVTIVGRLLRHGKVAKGWFTVEDAGCSTGRINWTATPD
jgi:hypothetical protein